MVGPRSQIEDAAQPGEDAAQSRPLSRTPHLRSCRYCTVLTLLRPRVQPDTDDSPIVEPHCTRIIRERDWAVNKSCTELGLAHWTGLPPGLEPYPSTPRQPIHRSRPRRVGPFTPSHSSMMRITGYGHRIGESLGQRDPRSTVIYPSRVTGLSGKGGHRVRPQRRGVSPFACSTFKLRSGRLWAGGLC